MSGAYLDRMVSRGVVIQMAARLLRDGADPLKVAELLERHDHRLYTVPIAEVPALVPTLAKEVGL